MERTIISRTGGINIKDERHYISEAINFVATLGSTALFVASLYLMVFFA